MDYLTSKHSLLSTQPNLYANLHQMQVEFNDCRMPIANDIMVKWTSMDDGIIKVPTTLKDGFKEGDVIYFYLDESYDVTQSPDYMLVMTNNLMQCDMNTFIENATASDPLKIKYLFDENNRVYSTTKTISLFKGSDSAIDNFTYNSLNNIVSACYDTAAIITKTDAASSYVDMDAVDNGNDRHIVFSSQNGLHVDASILKFDTLRLDESNAHQSNVELKSMLYGNVRTSQGFIKSLTTLDEYVYNDQIYVGKKIYAKDFFESYDQNCIYGYEVYDSSINAQLLEVKYATGDEMQILIDSLSPANIAGRTDESYMYLHLFAGMRNGMRHYSKTSRIDYKIVDGILDRYSITLAGDYVSMEASALTGNINFTTSNITCEKNGGFLTISPANSSIHLDGSVYFNNHIGDTYSNSWVDVSLLSGTAVGYTFGFDMSTNLPSIIVVNPGDEITDDGNETIQEYMTSLTALNDGESQLFYNKRNGIMLPST